MCDSRCRPLRADGSPIRSITAAGDVTRWPHPLTRGALLSLGHWTNASEQANAAAHALLHPDSTLPFAPLPSFWSDLHGTQIRSVGLPHLADTHTVVEHDPTRRRLVVVYHHHGQLMGAVTVNRTSRLTDYRDALQHLMDAGSLVSAEGPQHAVPSRQSTTPPHRRR